MHVVNLDLDVVMLVLPGSTDHAQPLTLLLPHPEQELWVPHPSRILDLRLRDDYKIKLTQLVQTLIVPWDVTMILDA